MGNAVQESEGEQEQHKNWMTASGICTPSMIERGSKSYLSPPGTGAIIEYLLCLRANSQLSGFRACLQRIVVLVRIWYAFKVHNMQYLFHGYPNIRIKFPCIS